MRPNPSAVNAGRRWNDKPNHTNTMNKQYILRPTRIHVLPEGESFFSEQSTIVQIEDEGAGEFIEISQNLDQHAPQLHAIRINDADEWNAIAAAVGDMFVEIGKRAPKDEALEQLRKAEMLGIDNLLKQASEF